MSVCKKSIQRRDFQELDKNVSDSRREGQCSRSGGEAQ